MNLLIPSFDTFTNLAYLLTTKFYSVGIFVALLLFAIHPVISFGFKLYVLRPIPGIRLYFPSRSALWLNYATGADVVPYPTANGQRISFLFDTTEHDSLYKLVWELMVWIIAVLMQFIFILYVNLRFVGFICFLPVCFAFGVLLELTNTLSIGRAWDVWFRLWTGTEEFSEPHVSIDTAMMNYGLMNRLLFETFPATITQIINNVLLKQKWTPVAILSLVASLFTFANLIYRYLYFQSCKKESLSMKEIPIETSIKVQLSCLGIDRTIIDGKLPVDGHSIISEKRKELKLDSESVVLRLRNFLQFCLISLQRYGNFDSYKVHPVQNIDDDKRYENQEDEIIQSQVREKVVEL